ncbi:MAG: hypothetical protein SGJ20_18285 [Planctomycetota bacterium]|nr:hypothetical protein [Planctomycetota bacterium]
MPSDLVPILLIAILTLVGLALLLPGWFALAGTTLRAPWCWAVATLLAVGGIELLVAVSPADSLAWVTHLRFAAAVFTFCPVIAQLGAKRPQESPWQLIVLSLWIVLVLPAGEAWVRGETGPLDLHLVRQWFLWILIVVGLFNNLPTRFGRAAVLFVVAQVLLFWPFLPGLGWIGFHPHPLAGLVALVVCLLELRFAARRTLLLPVTQGDSPTILANDPLNRIWREFRDWYGAVWSLRLLERLNATAEQQDWCVRFEWEGLHLRPSDPTQAKTATENDTCHAEKFQSDRTAIERVLRNLLWRFVSDEWIAGRLKCADLQSSDRPAV